jgi:6-phosphogluconolactonase
MAGTIVYVSNADSGELSVLQLDEDRGRLTALQTLAPGGILVLYVARRNEPFAVLAFSIEMATGRLTPLGDAALPHSMAHLATDATGRWLFSASYGGNLVAVSALDADGHPQPAHQVLPTPPKAHAMRAAPGNRFVFATSLGGDLVLQLRFDAATGRLAPNDPPQVAARAGAGPRHLAFHPDGRFVYLLDELDAGVDVFALDGERGTLAYRQTVSALPAGFSGEPWAADLHVTPDGRFLYASERRSSTLAAFAVDADTGQLAPLGSVPTQTQPRSFAITPSGRNLIVAGQLSNAVGVHAIDTASGALHPVGAWAVGRNPNWVEAIALA